MTDGKARVSEYTMDAAVQHAKDPHQAADITEASRETKDPTADFGWLPCQVSVEIPLTKFTVGHLLNLKKGSIVVTAYHSASDVPIRANGLLIGWTEFEVVGTHLTVRITEFA